MNLRGTFRGFFTEAARIIRQWLRLNWDWLYRAKSYINSSLWVVPFIALLVEQVIVRLTGSAGAWLAETGRSPVQSDLAEMDALWNRAKAEDKPEG